MYSKLLLKHTNASHLLLSTYFVIILFNLFFFDDYGWLHLIQLIQLLLCASSCYSDSRGNLHQLEMLLAAIPENL